MLPSQEDLEPIIKGIGAIIFIVFFGVLLAYVLGYLAICLLFSALLN